MTEIIPSTSSFEDKIIQKQIDCFPFRECNQHQTVSSAFYELARLVPVHPPDKKISKSDILRLAIR